MVTLPSIKKPAIVLGIIVTIVAISLIVLNINSSGNTAGGEVAAASKTVSQNGLTVAATLQSFSYGEQVRIDLSLNTHSGDLSFNPSNVATLKDSNGIRYAATAWSGSPISGHHASGTLIFPVLNGKPSTVALALTNVYGADWLFEWDLSK